MSDIANKIAGLLAQAEGTDNPLEAEAFQRQAEKLMAKYSIDQAVIDAKKAQGDREQIVTRKIFTTGGMAAAQQSLIHSVAMANGLQCFYSATGGKAREAWVYIVGFQSDVDMLHDMCTSLLVQADHALKSWVKANPWVRQQPSGGWLDKKQFVRSFGAGVAERFMKNRREVEAAQPGAALVLVDRKAAVEQWVAQTQGKLRPGHAQRMGSGHARHARLAGQAAGRAAVTNRSKALAS